MIAISETHTETETGKILNTDNSILKGLQFASLFKWHFRTVVLQLTRFKLTERVARSLCAG